VSTEIEQSCHACGRVGTGASAPEDSEDANRWYCYACWMAFLREDLATTESPRSCSNCRATAADGAWGDK
ncbi:unnamed protein product, partial [Polarella glacialis]